MPKGQHMVGTRMLRIYPPEVVWSDVHLAAELAGMSVRAWAIDALRRAAEAELDRGRPRACTLFSAAMDAYRRLPR